MLHIIVNISNLITYCNNVFLKKLCTDFSLHLLLIPDKSNCARRAKLHKNKIDTFALTICWPLMSLIVMVSDYIKTYENTKLTNRLI